jgi:hypothetical protein
MRALFEESWRLHTVTSTSVDTTLQATLHTPSQVRSLIRYNSGEEDLSEQEMAREIDGLYNVLDQENYYHVTLFLDRDGVDPAGRGLTEKLALRDGAGNEVQAVDILNNDSRKAGLFIDTSVGPVSGLDTNKGFLVRFPREGLSVEPASIQLVLYDVGDMPVRVMAWDSVNLN